MADISKIKLADVTYDVKDDTARASIETVLSDLDTPLNLSSYSKGDVISNENVLKIKDHKTHLKILYGGRLYGVSLISTTADLDAIILISLDGSGSADLVLILVISKATGATNYTLSDISSIDVAAYIEGTLTIKLNEMGALILTDGTRIIGISKDSSLSLNINLTLPTQDGTIALLSDTTVTSQKVTDALGYTPYDAANPAGYIDGITGQDVSVALGYTPYDANNPSRYISGITGADVTTALGYTPYNSTNPSGYITGISGLDVTAALGYTPYNNTNPNGYISGISSADVTTALGYTPYNSTNPNNYVNQTVSNLTNYFTKTEVQGMVGNRFQALIVQTLPASDISTSTIYMVLQAGLTDVYDEWMYISNTWTKIGTTSIDMSEYAKIVNLHNVALTGAYSSLVGKPDIPDDTSDLTNGAGYVTKAVDNLDNYTATNNLAAVALSGAYNDLTGKPAAITNVSQLSNDENYIKQSDLATTNISTLYNDVPYATLNQILGLEDIDVEEIKKAIAAMEHIGTVTLVTAGTGLTGGGNTTVTLNHSNSVTPISGYPSGTTLVNGGTFTVRDVLYDALGHITGSQNRTITMTEIPAYDDTAVRGLIADEATARSATDARVTVLENFNKDTFTQFVFCIFGIEPYIDPSTMQIVPNRYYLRSDVDTGIFMDSNKIDIHLKAWLKYHYNIEDVSYLKNVTCYVYAMGDHGEYVNHMVTFWSQINNPSITSYPHLQQVGSFIDDGYGSVHRFTTTLVGAILSSSDDGYVAADPTGTGKGYVSGWNTLTGRVTTLENTIGDINTALDEINGEVI